MNGPREHETRDLLCRLGEAVLTTLATSLATWAVEAYRARRERTPRPADETHGPEDQ